VAYSGGVQQIQLRTDGRENVYLGAVAPYSGVPLNLQMGETRILIRLLRMYFPQNWEFAQLCQNQFFFPHSIALLPTHPLTVVSPKEFLGGKVRPALTADRFAVLVVPNVKVRVEARHSIPL
jgi:hypothetical protein